MESHKPPTAQHLKYQETGYGLQEVQTRSTANSNRGRGGGGGQHVQVPQAVGDNKLEWSYNM